MLKRVCVCVCACLFANLMCSFICCSWSDRITRVAKGCSDPTNGITIAELYKYTHKYRVKYICARKPAAQRRRHLPEYNAAQPNNLAGETGNARGKFANNKTKKEFKKQAIK